MKSVRNIITYISVQKKEWVDRSQAGPKGFLLLQHKSKPVSFPQRDHTHTLTLVAEENYLNLLGYLENR
jgi:hypothetical protein